MAELNLDDIMRIAESEDVAKNATSLTDLLKEVDNIVKQGDKILGFINRIERSPLVGTALRAKLKNSGVELTALVGNGGITPNSDLHRQVFDNMNKLNEDQLKHLIIQMDQLEKQNQSKSLDEATKDES